MTIRTGRPIFRIAAWLGGIFIAAAAIAFLYEAVLAFQTGGWRIVPAGEIWFKLHNGSLNLVQAIVQRFLHPFLWDPLISGFLQWPLWASLGGTGFALTIIFGSRRAR